MSPPPCPQPQQFVSITGFITPGSDLPVPHQLDASISVDVFDATPGENNERIRIVETGQPWNVVVEWCICGVLVPMICGCWEVCVYIDDIDGVAPSSGLLVDCQVVGAKSGVLTKGSGDDPIVTRCYQATFTIPGDRVRVDPISKTGVYDLVAVITLRDEGEEPHCKAPGARLPDTLGFAEIPALVFFTD